MTNKANVFVITIDGESSTGKTVLSQYLAKELGYNFLNSGTLYRALAYLKTHHPRQELSMLLEFLEKKLTIRLDDYNATICLGDLDITSALMLPDIAALASEIAADAEVRKGLLPIQQGFLEPPGLVAEGRDMGGVIFPSANLKLYLTAPFEVRLGRRFLQLKEMGQNPDILLLSEQMQQRDQRDRTRKASPLLQHKDAIVFDTTHDKLDENKDKLKALVLEIIQQLS
ncbi:(d)CMP kinase [Gammaproteobacteria bacterium]|nr:(d)CMP kinase [Gammaproteobacteria bacterium]